MQPLPKKDWDLEDYPIRVRQRDRPDDLPPDMVEHFQPWAVNVVGWFWMDGFGQTREEAWAELRQKFADYKASGEPLPKPGEEVPLKFASTDKISQYDDLATDFFRRILDMDYSQVFVSDQSSLWDFPIESQESTLANIKEIYGVDVSDIKDGNLARIFARITGE